MIVSDGRSPILEDSETVTKNADLRFLAFGKPGTAISVSCIFSRILAIVQMHLSEKPCLCKLWKARRFSIPSRPRGPNQRKCGPDPIRILMAWYQSEAGSTVRRCRSDLVQ